MASPPRMERVERHVGPGLSASKNLLHHRRRRGSHRRRVVVGVCAMDKKTRAKPMQNILGRLSPKDFKVCIFGDDVLTKIEPDRWPKCDVLMSFFSSGFPLEKAERYVALRRPMLINDLSMEHRLRDRREFYDRLERFSIPTARRVVVDRDDGVGPELEEREDYIVVNGKRLQKPFVEKPVDAEDHNVHVYYPRSMGGGVKELFRKVKNQSSRFVPDRTKIRRDASYIYEEFLMTGGLDIKVYVVGPDYAHAEARKSPVLDGVVLRDDQGKEVRYPILLSPEEKLIARKVCLAFRQNVCGFDLLRTPESGSFVCDVNGWSFVKKSHKYYDDASGILADMMLGAVAPDRLAARQHKRRELAAAYATQPLTTTGRPVAAPTAAKVLRCVIGVIRHGDRTPKQKLKLTSKLPHFIQLHRKYAAHSHDNVKIKSAAQLQDVLDATRDAVSAEGHSPEVLSSLVQMRSILEAGGRFSGINRKVQLKPTKWEDVATSAPTSAGGDGGVPSPSPEKPFGWGRESADDESSDPEVADRVAAVQIVVKWGGVLTHAGQAQALALGETFRTTLYPGEDINPVRLHATFRHDLKMYASDEGRVQMTAAAFAKGFLELEGALTPILASLVRCSRNRDKLLDDSSAATKQLRTVKSQLHEALSEEVADPPMARRTSTSSTERGSDDSDGALAVGMPRVDSSVSAAGSRDAESSAASISVPVGFHLRRADAVEPKYRAHFAPTAQRNHMLDALAPERTSLSVIRSLTSIGFSPTRALQDLRMRIYQLTKHLHGQIDHLDGTEPLTDSPKLDAFADLDGVSVSIAASGHRVSDATDGDEEIGPVDPCGSENLWLVRERWRKMNRELYDDKKKRFDMSKIPDVYDCIKYDAIHNRGFSLPSCSVLLSLARSLADIVIPLEYGITVAQKCAIASAIAFNLAEKIHDELRAGTRGTKETLRNIKKPEPGLWIGSVPPTPAVRLDSAALAARRDSVVSSEGEHSTPEADEPATAADLTGEAATSAEPLQLIDHGDREDPDPAGAGGGMSSAESGSEQEGDDDVADGDDGRADAPHHHTPREGDLLITHEGSTEEGTEATHEPLRSPPSSPMRPATERSVDSAADVEPNVRTRLFFTSESHIHSMLNILRHSMDKTGKSLLTPAALGVLSKTPELDYMTHFVFRMFEDRSQPLESDKRFVTEILFSPGASESCVKLAAPDEADGAAHGDDASETGSVSPSRPGSVASSTASSMFDSRYTAIDRDGRGMRTRDHKVLSVDETESHTVPIARPTLLAGDVPLERVLEVLSAVTASGRAQAASPR